MFVIFSFMEIAIDTTLTDLNKTMEGLDSDRE